MCLCCVNTTCVYVLTILYMCLCSDHTTRVYVVSVLTSNFVAFIAPHRHSASYFIQIPHTQI